jgi:hypothetical protein
MDLVDMMMEEIFKVMAFMFRLVWRLIEAYLNRPQKGV